MEKYNVIGKIGKGSFGLISKIMRKSDKKILIWKELNFGNIPKKEKELITNEINILKELNHPNIVKQYEVIKDDINSKIYIVMEFCEGGDLDQLILKNKNNKQLADEKLIWDIIIQILNALNYIHNEKKVLHRDIKPSNIFLDKEYNIKLGDFGFSKKLFSEYAKTILGTILYMAPEILERKQYNEKADIWALGCSIYELTSFQTPYDASNKNNLLTKIKNGLPQRIDKKYSDELWNFITKMLTYDYNQRPNSIQLINYYDKLMISKNDKLLNDDDNIKAKWKELILFEEELKKKEKEQKEKDKEQIEKEKTLSKKDIKQKEKEKELIEKEININEMLNKINKEKEEQKEREKELKMKEELLKEKEEELQKKIKNIFNDNKVNINNKYQNDLTNKFFNNKINNNLINLNNNNELNSNQIIDDNNQNDLNNNQINLNNNKNNFNIIENNIDNNFNLNNEENDLSINKKILNFDNENNLNNSDNLNINEININNNQINNNYNNENNDYLNFNEININNNQINNNENNYKIKDKNYNNIIFNNNILEEQLTNYLVYKNKKIFPKIGLKNLGDNSYLNPVLQILGNIEEFVNYFLDPDKISLFESIKDEIPLSFAIKELFLHLYPKENENYEYDPSKILKVLSKKNKNYNNNKIYNPNNLINELLFYLNIELNKSNTFTEKNIFFGFYDRDSINVDLFLKDNDSIIFDLFNWFKIEKCKLMRCNSIIYYLKTLNNFKLEFPVYCSRLSSNQENNYIKIEDCLKFQLSKINFGKVFCGKCQEHENIEYYNEIYSLPNLFLFSLDRGININEKKNFSIPFIVEDKLNLDNFIQLKDKSFPINYELIGIVSISIIDEKYIAMCKSSIDNQWYYFKDEKVQLIEHNNVIKLSNNINYYIPCILIYKRIINKNN